MNMNKTGKEEEMQEQLRKKKKKTYQRTQE